MDRNRFFKLCLLVIIFSCPEISSAQSFLPGGNLESSGLNFISQNGSKVYIFETVGSADGIRVAHFNGLIEAHSLATTKDDYNYYFDSSNIEIYLQSVVDKKIQVYFKNDSLKNNFSIVLPRSQVADFYFSNCKIDCPISFQSDNSECRCFFDHCEFGANAIIAKYPWHQITFTNCRVFDRDLIIDSKFSELNPGRVSIFIADCDVSHLRFPYLGNFKLTRIDSLPFEGFASNYEVLLGKYLEEGKVSSYKNMKIEYERFLYHHCKRAGWLRNFFDDWWWTYGFDRINIFYRVLTFLGIFFLVNLFCAHKPLHQFFPFYGGDKVHYYSAHSKPHLVKPDRCFRIFMITLMIFFALPINSKKLFQFQARFIAWILFQYLIGLICLSFILNFVLKL